MLDALPDDWREPGHGDTPEALLSLKRTKEAAMRLPGHLPTVFALMYAGYGIPEIAQEIGVSESRVSQLKNELERALG